MVITLLPLLFLASTTQSRWINYECYIQLDLQSCLSCGINTVQIEIKPYGPIRTHYIDTYYPQVCHPIKCVNGLSSDDISIVARAILSNHESVITTEPMGFHKDSALYTSEEECYYGSANVTVECPTVFQPGAYSLSDSDDSFSLECGSNEALHPVSKEFVNIMEAKKWEFQCKTSMKLSHTTCQWSEKVNSWESNAFYQCPLNSVMTGVKSYYENENEQPHFQFKCCSTPGYSTTSCKLSKSNKYPAQEDMLVGAYVPAKNSRNEEDWQFLSCDYQSNSLWSKLP